MDWCTPLLICAWTALLGWALGTYVREFYRCWRADRVQAAAIEPEKPGHPIDTYKFAQARTYYSQHRRQPWFIRKKWYEKYPNDPWPGFGPPYAWPSAAVAENESAHRSEVVEAFEAARQDLRSIAQATVRSANEFVKAFAPEPLDPTPPQSPPVKWKELDLGTLQLRTLAYMTNPERLLWILINDRFDAVYPKRITRRALIEYPDDAVIRYEPDPATGDLLVIATRKSR